MKKSPSKLKALERNKDTDSIMKRFRCRIGTYTWFKEWCDHFQQHSFRSFLTWGAEHLLKLHVKFIRRSLINWRHTDQSFAQSRKFLHESLVSLVFIVWTTIAAVCSESEYVKNNFYSPKFTSQWNKCTALSCIKCQIEFLYVIHNHDHQGLEKTCTGSKYSQGRQTGYRQQSSLKNFNWNG